MRLAAIALVALLSQTPGCIDPEQREQIRALMHSAIDQALQAQMKHLFAIWMRDPTHQPFRARSGMEQAVKAYLQIDRNIDLWEPSLCVK